MADYEFITLQRHEGVATLTLNRPEKRNAISDAMRTELIHALEAVALVGWRLGGHDEGVASTPPAPEPVLSERVPEVREAVATTPATTVERSDTSIAATKFTIAWVYYS